MFLKIGNKVRNIHRTEVDIMAATFTILIKLGIFTEREVKDALVKGYEETFEMLNKKFDELERQGKFIK